MDKLVCIELGQTNIYGTTPCKTWVAQPPGVLDSLAITKTQAVEISGLILGFFVVLVVGSVMAKSINLM